VESNPRLTLRIPLLRQAADIFGDQKYLISIKVKLYLLPCVLFFLLPLINSTRFVFLEGFQAGSGSKLH
jgi:hypothetical protein